MQRRLTPAEHRAVFAAVRARSHADLAAIVSAAAGPHGSVRGWAEVIWLDPDDRRMVGLRELDDGSGRPGRELSVDEPGLRAGLRRAIEAAVEIEGEGLEAAIARHAALTPEVGDRAIQFAVFGADHEVYPVGRGVAR
jgi:hypothetical protein